MKKKTIISMMFATLAGIFCSCGSDNNTTFPFDTHTPPDVCINDLVIPSSGGTTQMVFNNCEMEEINVLKTTDLRDVDSIKEDSRLLDEILEISESGDTTKITWVEEELKMEVAGDTMKFGGIAFIPDTVSPKPNIYAKQIFTVEIPANQCNHNRTFIIKAKARGLWYSYGIHQDGIMEK